ncbi:hypothetical protein pipiens_009065 [Culex pipiens pipiens]|uniref:SAM-dependent MTase RsmB/NOP-type domain-containing protein n=1 Tax=Culex pipiens pipiens TaxID=38569 RepID=A0ABD1DFW1_CULPP
MYIETEGEVGGKLVYMTCSLNPIENGSLLLAEMVEKASFRRSSKAQAKPWEPTTKDMQIPENYRTVFRPLMLQLQLPRT